MPKGTRVARCVEEVKKKGGNANPYAVCQSSTHQSYATGRSLKGLTDQEHAEMFLQRLVKAHGDNPRESDVLPKLKPEQHAKLANKHEERALHHAGRYVGTSNGGRDQHRLSRMNYHMGQARSHRAAASRATPLAVEKSKQPKPKKKEVPKDKTPKAMAINPDEHTFRIFAQSATHGIPTAKPVR